MNKKMHVKTKNKDTLKLKKHLKQRCRYESQVRDKKEIITNQKRSRCAQRVGLPYDSEQMRYDGK